MLANKKIAIFSGLKEGLSDIILGTEPDSLIAYWPMNDGSASQEYLTFNGTSTNIVISDAASIQDLHDAILCVDFWIKPGTSTANDIIITKSSASDEGWIFVINTDTPKLLFRVYDNSGTPVTSQSDYTGTLTPGTWYHVTGYFNDGGDRKAYIAVGGTWQTAGNALVDPVGSDVGVDLTIGSGVGGNQEYTGDIGWIRISNNDRLGVGVDFTGSVPSRTTIPTVDANTVGLWPMNEGYGTVAGDLSANNNDGTITDGDWGAYPAADNAEGTSARDGAYTGVMLGQAQSPFVAPFFDGVNDLNNIYSASLAGAFSGAAGTAMCFAKVSGSGVWTDGANRNLFNIVADTNNIVQIFKTTTNNRLQYYYRAGGTTEAINLDSVSDTGWLMFCGTWDKAGSGNFTAYYNGAVTGTPQAIAGTWAGSPSATQTIIGAFITTPTQVWSGYLAHCAVWTKALTATQILNIYKASGI